MEISAHEALVIRMCKTLGCDGEVDQHRGRFAGLCGVCRRAAIRKAQAEGTFATRQRPTELVSAARAAAQAASALAKARRRRRPETAATREFLEAYVRLGRAAGVLRR